MAKIFRALFYGLAAFFMVAALAIIESYIRCLVIGVNYSFMIAVPIAAKVGAVVGMAIMILTFIGPPKSENPRKR